MEAENYLSGGYGIRISMEARESGRLNIGNVANIWQPGRLKGVLVSRDYGTPFFAATQVFDLRPTPRKYLSLHATRESEKLFVQPGQILITRSGSVGRATIAHAAHEGVIISDDLLRVEPLSAQHWGWVYAFLRSPQARAMMGAAQYGHVIKHLETGHVSEIPIPDLREELMEPFQSKAEKILALRTASFEGTAKAESMFERSFPSLQIGAFPKNGFSVSARSLFGERRRLDASRYVPTVDEIVRAYERDAIEVDTLSGVASRVFVPGRFKHVYGDGGMPYLDSADILEVNPDITKFVLSLSEEEQRDYHVEAGWLLIPCSGQVHGNIGHTILATEWYEGKVLTNHILRIVPDENVRSGYLQCVLGHRTLGRPQIIRFAFGSSVPEISPDDLRGLVIPRLGAAVEGAIADLMDAAAKARDEADELEQELARDAEHVIDKFLSGDLTLFRVSGAKGTEEVKPVRPPSLRTADPAAAHSPAD